MSHFVRVRTQLREKTHLVQALKDLGYTVGEGDAIRLLSDNSQEESAEIVIDTDCAYQVGFRFLRGHYEMVADWYNIERLTELKRLSFLQTLTQRYSYAVIRDQAQQQHLIIEEERQENGEIILILSERG